MHSRLYTLLQFIHLYRCLLYVRPLMSAHAAVCQACHREVQGEIFHLGFSDMDALYCSKCPKVLLLKDWRLPQRRGILPPTEREFQYYSRQWLPYYAKVEALFRPCACGGHYGYMNPPRCPLCNGLLRGDCYEDKPILKQRDGYVFVCAGSVNDSEQLLQPEV